MKTRIFLAAGLLVLPLAVLAQTAPKPLPKPAPVPATPTPGSTITTAPAAPAAKAPAAAPSVLPAARVALVTGSVTVVSGQSARTLHADDPVYEGETLTVGPNSYASLKFADGGRVLLRPDTEFAVESFKYAPASAAAPAATPGAAPAAAPTGGTAFFRLVRGGFRAITGLIGKGDRANYRVTTPAATIGIRGTDYEVQTCAGDCPAQAQAVAGGTEVASTDLAGLELAQAGGSNGGGIIVATHAGSITLRTSRGEFVVDVGQVALALASGQTFMLPAVPDVMLQNLTPSPDACE